MTQETIPYLHGNCIIGGVIDGAVLVNGMTYMPGALPDDADDMLRKAVKEAQEKTPGWRPPAWWFDLRLENPEQPSHYAGYLPISLVKERLFGWSALDGTMKVRVPLMVQNPDAAPGEMHEVWVEFPITSHKGIVREDLLRKAYEAGTLDDADANNAFVLGVHGEDYTAHQLAQTFITETANIVGGTDSLGVTSGLLLRGGRVASMEISIPEELHDDSTGFAFRPNLVVSTSFNGTLPTSWTRTITATVCDNTLQYALQQAGETGKYKIRHTKNSLVHIKDAAQALGLIHQQADTFTEVLREWSQTEVTEQHFQKWLNEMYPVPDAKTEVQLSEAGEKVGERTVTNSQTLIMNKRNRLIEMWDTDPRVTGPERQWKNTKLAMAQLINTYGQHEDTVKGVKNLGGNRLQARVESNMFKALKMDRAGMSELAKRDKAGLEKLDLILADDPAPVPVAVGADTAPARQRSSRTRKSANNN